MGDDADHTAVVGELFQQTDGVIQCSGIQRAEAFVNEHGIHLDAAGLLLDRVREPQRQRERRQKSFSAGQRFHGSAPVGVEVQDVKIQAGGDVAFFLILPAHKLISSARKLVELLVRLFQHLIEIVSLNKALERDALCSALLSCNHAV